MTRLSPALLTLLSLAPLGVAALTDGPDPTVPAATLQVEVHDGILTLEAINAPLSEVVRAIGEEGGFETLVEGDIDARITRSFVDVPLKRGLRYLLDGISTVMFYAAAEDTADAQRITEVWLLGMAGPAPAPLRRSDRARPDPQLVAQLFAPERETRVKAIRELAQSGNLQAVHPLGRVLGEDDDPSVRSHAAGALGEIGDPAAVPTLQAALEDSNQSVRIRAIRALAEIEGDRATRLLGEILLDQSERRSRLVAAWALGRRNASLARSYLEAASRAEDALVRRAANRSLSRLDDDFR